MARTPDRESFLRRLEEQQHESRKAKEPNISNNEHDRKNETSKIITYLNEHCGISDISLDEMDASSLELLAQMTPQKCVDTTEKERNITENSHMDQISENKDPPQFDFNIAANFKDDIDSDSQVALCGNITIMESSEIQDDKQKNLKKDSDLSDSPPLKEVRTLSERDMSCITVLPESSSKLPSSHDITNSEEAIQNVEDTNVLSSINEISSKIAHDVSGITMLQEKSNTSFFAQDKKLEENGDKKQEDYFAQAAILLKNIENQGSNNESYQEGLIRLLRTQNELLLQTRNQLESLEKHVEKLQTHLIQTSASSSTPPLPNNWNESNPALTTRLPQHASQPDMSLFLKVKSKYESVLQSLLQYRTIRALRHAYNEAHRQNVFENLDIHAFFKMIFFVVLLGGRNSPLSSDDMSFMERYRMQIIGMIAVFFYFVQAGIISFLYRFLTIDLKRLEADDITEQNDRNSQESNTNTIDGVQPEIDANQMSENNNEGSKNDNNLNNAEIEQDQRNDTVGNNEVEITNDDNPNIGQPRNFADGVIDNRGGLVVDVMYLVGSFIFSLAPAWKPIKMEDPVEAPIIEDAQQDGGEDQNDDMLHRVD